jgi:anti-sigma factor RsiW
MNSHLTDEQILSEMDGEIPASERKRIRSHLDACWECRTRSLDLQNAITGFIHVYKQEFEDRLPSKAGPRALLKARLEQLSAERQISWALPAALCAVLIGVLVFTQPLGRRHQPGGVRVVSSPEHTITPGAAVLLSRAEVCAENRVNNKPVPAALERKVLEEYGVAGSDALMYEIDYLEGRTIFTTYGPIRILRRRGTPR